MSVFFGAFLHLLLVCIRAEPDETVDSSSDSFSMPSVFICRLAIWLLVVGSYATATGQTGVPEASSSPNWKAGLLSSVSQCEKDKSPEASPQALRTLRTAKTVFIAGKPFMLGPTRKAEQTLKNALVRWG